MNGKVQLYIFIIKKLWHWGSKSTPVPNTNGFASQWNIGLSVIILLCSSHNSGAAKLTYHAFYDKSMKFGTVIPWTIPISFGRGGNLAHA